MKEMMIEPSAFRSAVEKAKAGDRQSFEELVKSIESRLRSTVEVQVQRDGNFVEVDEVVQETIVHSYESICRFEWQGEDSFFHWLCGISRNIILRLAKRSRKDRKLQVPEDLPATAPSPSRILRRGERFDRLQQAVSKLPPDYREVLRLSRIERLKIKEIARRMDRSEFAVKHLMARAVKQLRETFGDTESLHLPDQAIDMGGSGNGR